MWIGTPQAPEVVVAYGCYDGGFVSYITNETPAYTDPDGLVREAFDNLKGHDVDLQVVGSGADRVVIAAGPFTAEQVLSERHVLAVHERLESAEIVVSIPAATPSWPARPMPPSSSGGPWPASTARRGAAFGPPPATRCTTG